ncbi:tetratricopeptide repeat-containing glycosyltransferase family protein [Phenylobacterium sp.]|uniref:tetratricopeptide repeat-containing glycosyltransferase family protein n=1 Tax=Phenylobacterium sp. TaxID=1871053 RepID=UPI0025DF8693|nr:tetratricopeptide repeat-containing glycosyltransferase family protein [Phenylobacterium sp.]MCA6312834.1 glycosyltransferase family protein [Phenylobacterium sp.]
MADAARLYEQILAAEPSNFDALHLLGLTAHQSGDHERAVELISAALRIDQAQPDACSNIGLALQALGRFSEALAFTDAAIALRPGSSKGYSNRGNILRDMKRLQEALASLDRAVALDPSDAIALNNRGNVLLDLGRLEEALAGFDRAIALRSDLVDAHLNRGNALAKLHRLEEALECIDGVLAIEPQRAAAHANRGAVLQELRRLDEAIAAYDRAIELKPDFAGAKFNKALALLLDGRFDEGWPLYECRVVQGMLSLPKPAWLGGKEIRGRTVLLHSEQGLGDTLQFCRYAALVKEMQARVILRVPSPLVGFVSTLQGVDAVVSESDALPEFDEHCPLLSLPLAFRTRLDTIPAPSPYLSSRADRRQFWSRRLGAANGLRVGLAWSGNWNSISSYNRFLSVADLTAHLPKGPTYVGLQKEVRPIDLEALANSQVLFLGDEIRDFEDTAALCDLLDLVITVDTSLAHVSGALARPTWVLLSKVPDWRWMLDRPDSPWYPTARLYRQSVMGRWDSVLEQVAEDLTRLAEEKGPR